MHWRWCNPSLQSYRLFQVAKRPKARPITCMRAMLATSLIYSRASQLNWAGTGSLRNGPGRAGPGRVGSSSVGLGREISARTDLWSRDRRCRSAVSRASLPRGSERYASVREASASLDLLLGTVCHVIVETMTFRETVYPKV